MVELGRGIVTFKIEKRFGVADAAQVRRTVEQVAPVSEVAIDFSAASVVEDTALLMLADLIHAQPSCRFRLSGLTHHRRRMLTYMGVHHTTGGSRYADAPAVKAVPVGVGVQGMGEPATAA